MKDSLSSTNTSYHIFWWIICASHYYSSLQVCLFTSFQKNLTLVNSGSPKAAVELFGCLALGDVPALRVQKERETEVGVVIELLGRTESSL